MADSSSLLIKAFVYLTLGYLKIHNSAMQGMSGEPDSYVGKRHNIRLENK